MLRSKLNHVSKMGPRRHAPGSATYINGDGITSVDDELTCVDQQCKVYVDARIYYHSLGVDVYLGEKTHMMTSSNGNISAWLGLCEGNSPVTGEFPAQRPVTRYFDVSFDLRLNKRLRKPSRWRWVDVTVIPNGVYTCTQKIKLRPSLYC